MNRRQFLLGPSVLALSSALVGCRPARRCKHCGMKLDERSAWRAELVDDRGAVTATFDTPRCALTSWRSGVTAAKALHVQEYYEGAARDGEQVVFVVGGDVVGPMGPDLVPVDPARAAKFLKDHGAERALRLDEVTLPVLAGVGAR